MYTIIKTKIFLVDTFRFDIKKCLSKLSNSKIIKISFINSVKYFLRAIKLIVPTVLHMGLSENLLHGCNYFFLFCLKIHS